MSPTTEQSRNTVNNSFEESSERHRSFVLRERYKWRILFATSVINVILAGVLPSLGILLYYDLQDKQVSMKAAIRTPIYFIVSWCIADSWSQTAYTTTSFKKIAVTASIVTAVSIIINFTFHDTLESVGSQYLLGIMAGVGVRLLMTTSENTFSEYFSTKSTWAVGFHFLITHSLGFILVPFLVAYAAETEGIHYAILMLGVMELQTLPAVILLRKPKDVHSSNRLYLTNQPAYALLHQNVIDDSDEQTEEAESSLSQPHYGTITSLQHIDEEISPGNELQRIGVSPGRSMDATDGKAVPLFTDVELVAGTYEGEVAYSFEDTTNSESPRYDRSELFFRAVARRRKNEQSYERRCCTFSMTPSLNREFHPCKHPAMYLGLISMIAQKAIVITTWILLPSLIGGFPHFRIHNYDFEFSSKIGATFVFMVIGITSSPVILIPFTFSSVSYAGRMLTHGICTALAAVFSYGIGKRLPELHIIALIFFGLCNGLSAGTLEPTFKEILLRNYRFEGHKSSREEWGKIRGLANTVVGLIILLTSIAIDVMFTDWDTIDWPLIFYMTATLQMFAGLVWIVTPCLQSHFT